MPSMAGGICWRRELGKRPRAHDGGDAIRRRWRRAGLVAVFALLLQALAPLLPMPMAAAAGAAASGPSEAVRLALADAALIGCGPNAGEAIPGHAGDGKDHAGDHDKTPHQGTKCPVCQILQGMGPMAPAAAPVLALPAFAATAVAPASPALPAVAARHSPAQPRAPPLEA